MSEDSILSRDWQRDLRGKIAWALAAKLAALVLLWFFFFRGGHS
jgi:hypothetical protein